MFTNGETVIVRRPGTTVDGYGEPQLDWSEGVVRDRPVSGCAVWARGSSENNDGRSAVIIGIQVAFPPNEDVQPTDRLVWHGQEFDVEGQPFPWRSPHTGWEPGVEVSARAVNG